MKAIFPHPLAGLRNLGPVSRGWLVEAGVNSRARLASLGTIEVCRLVLAAGHPATLNLAYGLEAALHDCDWRELPHEFRLKLQADFALMRKQLSAARLNKS